MAELIGSGYKETKVGVVPQDREVVKISELWKVMTWKTPSTTVGEYWSDWDWIPFITPSDIANEWWIYQSSSQRFISDEGLNFTTIVPPESILVTCIASIGKIKMTSEVSSFNQQINAIVPFVWMNWKFIYYQLINNKTELLQYAGKVAVPIINKSTFEWLSLFAIPNNPLEQEKIANILSKVDELITQTDEIIKKQGILKSWLLNKLIKTPSSTDYVNWKISDILKIKYWKDRKKVNDRLWNIPIFWTWWLMWYTSTPLYSMPSVLIWRKGTIDKPMYIDVPFWTVDTLFYSEIVAWIFPKWAYYLFLTIPRKKYNEATWVPSLNANTIESIDIHIPPIRQQEKIVHILSKIDQSIDEEENNKTQLIKLRQWLMNKLLTWELRINF